MNANHVTRRQALGSAVTSALAGAIGFSAIATPSPLATAAPANARRRSLRLAHLTDIHIQPELHADQGFAACLKHVQAQADAPELILFGGDSVMDSLAADDARTGLQWDMWKRTLRDECSLKSHSCIGNHDVWGWDTKGSKTTGDEPTWGKRRALDMFGLDERYYAFEQAGWQFIVLDSTQPLNPGDGSYTAFVDEPQFDWLEQTLRDTPAERPTLVLSHIPILSASAILWAEHKDRQHRVSDSLMHGDCLRLFELFSRHPQVKLCLSGHLHTCDRVDFQGVTYLCNGAVSGAWWKGKHKGFAEGYAAIDLFDDGTFASEYVAYGWQAEPA